MTSPAAFSLMPGMDINKLEKQRTQNIVHVSDNEELEEESVLSL